MKTFGLAVFVLLALGIGGAYVFISTGAMPANADAQPSAFETWAAKRSLHATIARQAPKGEPPLPVTEENLVAGVGLYAENCAVCHGAADGQASDVAIGLYQHAPQLATHGVEDDEEGETYWKIYHGVRLTGMPSYRAALSERQIWQLTLFLKHMDALSPAVKKAWDSVPSQAPKIKREGA